LVGFSLIFNYLNGFHDSSNIVATIIFSRAISPRWALLLAAAAESVGPFIFGVAVAKTIGEEIVQPDAINIQIILAALLAGILWNLVTWFFGIPSSSSHALIGGILGAVIIGVGFQTIQISGLVKILLSLLLSPLLGLVIGNLFTHLVYFLSKKSTPRINHFFKRSQIFTGIGLALSHGANDAQKTMGIITLGLVTTGYLDHFVVPTWVILVCAAAMVLGTLSGGWRLIRTLGSRFYKIRPINGFCSQVSSTLVILGAALLGGPVSTTQVVSSSIMGVGSAERINKVRWGVAVQIITAWFLTIPVTALISAGFYRLLILLGEK
jgi:inorganic phosphate transporter, PiT family